MPIIESIKKYVNPLTTAAAGFSTLALYEAFNSNKLAAATKELQSQITIPCNMTAIQEIADKLNQDAISISRELSIGVSVILAIPVLFSTWDSFKHMHGFVDKIKSPLQNWDFHAGILLDSVGVALLGTAIHNDGSGERQTATALSCAGIFALGAGGVLIKRHHNRTQGGPGVASEYHQEYHQLEEGEGESIRASAPPIYSR